MYQRLFSRLFYGIYSWASKWVGHRENITDKFGIFDGDISDIVVGMPVTDWGWGYQWKATALTATSAGFS